MNRHLMAGAISLAILLVPLLSFAAEGSSLGEAQASFGAGDYRGCLQIISRALAKADAKPGTPMRYDLLMLRGEAAIRLNMKDLGREAFSSAARTVKEQGNLERFCAAEAMSLLVKSATGTKYMIGEESVSIADPEGRKRAMQALFEKKLIEAKGDVDGVLGKASLVPVFKLLPELLEVYVLETAAKGSPAESLELGRSVGAHARELIDQAMGKMSARVDELAELATEPYSSGRRDDIKARGLNTNERQELTDMLAELDKVRATGQQGRRIAQRLGNATDKWDKIVADCDDLISRAKHTLSMAY